MESSFIQHLFQNEDAEISSNFGSRVQMSRDKSPTFTDLDLINADEFFPALEFCDTSINPVYLLLVLICSATGGGDVLVQLCSTVAESNLRPSRKPPWLWFYTSYSNPLFETNSNVTTAALYLPLWTLIILYDVCFMPTDPSTSSWALSGCQLYPYQIIRGAFSFNANCYVLSMVILSISHLLLYPASCMP